jgi:hypothetical protein
MKLPRWRRLLLVGVDDRRRGVGGRGWCRRCGYGRAIGWNDGEIFYTLREAQIVAPVQAASTGGICPCLRRVAGCATPTGSAGHASVTASLKLTFHLDHSVGANHHIKCEMKAPRIDPAVPELAALSALAALGCGLAAAQGDLWFVTLFGAASVVTIIEVVRRLL